jgi:hypothetical protein
MNSHRSLAIITLIAGLLLAACGGAIRTGTGASSSALSTNYADALPVAGQLAAGTLKLEGSQVAVDAEQAAQLLPLWQGLSSLLSSATSSDLEVQGVVAQIESAMTAEQVAAIAAMQITQADVTTLVQNAGGAQSGATSDQVQATRRASSGGNFRPGGGFGPGGGDGAFIGGGPGSGGAGLPGASSGFPQSTAAADQQATPAAYQNQYASTGVNPMMVRAVIQYLQSKTG